MWKVCCMPRWSLNCLWTKNKIIFRVIHLFLFVMNVNTKSNILILIQRLTADGAYSPIFECDESALVQVNFILFFKKKNKQKQWIDLFWNEWYLLLTFQKLPYRKWSAEAASTIMCTYGTVWHSLVVRGRLAENERVLITGAGGVAAAAVQIARAWGCQVCACFFFLKKKKDLLYNQFVSFFFLLQGSCCDKWF